MSLDSIFGIMSTLNSTVAIISGLAGEGLVAATGTKVSPFLAAVLCLGLAFWIMKKTWVSATNIRECLAIFPVSPNPKKRRC